jgi:hypothetical protein
VEYAPGTTEEVALHDGSTLRLAKLAADYDPFDRIGAMNYLQSRAAVGELVTGLIYMDASATDMHANLNTVPAALNRLSEKELPRRKGLELQLPRSLEMKKFLPRCCHCDLVGRLRPNRGTMPIFPPPAKPPEPIFPAPWRGFVSCPMPGGGGTGGPAPFPTRHLVCRAGTDVRQSLLGGHQNPFRLGAAPARHHLIDTLYNYAVEPEIVEAGNWASSRHHKVCDHHPRPWRS